MPPRIDIAAGDMTVGVVHPLELVARAEANGYTDEDARLLGWQDLFDFAYDPVILPDVAPADNASRAESAGRADTVRTWPIGLAFERGFLFVLPGLMITGLFPTIRGVVVTAILIVGLIIPWSLGQGLAYAAYSLRGTGVGHENRLLVASIVTSLVLAGPLVVVLNAVSGDLGLGVMVAAEFVYLIAATAGIVRGVSRWILVALLPGALAGVSRLLAGLDTSPEPWQIAFSLASVAATVGLAVFAALPLNSSRATDAVSRNGVSSFLTYGLLVAVSVVWLPLAFPGLPVLSGLLALTLSMGAADMCLIAYRTMGRRWLDEAAGSSSVFVKQARRGLVQTTGVYAGCLAVLLIITLVLPVTLLQGFSWSLIRIAALIMSLGLSLQLASLLVAFRAIEEVLLQWSVAVVLLLVAGLWLSVPVAPVTAVVYLLLNASTVATAARRITQPNLHL